MVHDHDFDLDDHWSGGGRFQSLEKENDFSHCWHQAADADDYAWQQKLRIDQLLDRQNEIYANEGSMALDDATAVHFAVVELGVMSGTPMDLQMSSGNASNRSTWKPGEQQCHAKCKVFESGSTACHS